MTAATIDPVGRAAIAAPGLRRLATDTLVITRRNLRRPSLPCSCPSSCWSSHRSVFLPTATMPDWLRVFADNQPITAVANAIRGLMLGEAALPVGQAIGGQVMTAFAWIAGITFVFGGLAMRFYRRIDA